MSKMDEVELTFYRRMMAQVQAGGWLVASSACGTVEIAWARTEGRMFVDQDGIGYVVRPAASMPAPVESAPMPGAVMVAVDAFADARDACLRAEHARGWKEAVEACARLFSPLATRYDGETVIARILHQLHDSTTFTRPDQEKKT